MMTEYGNCKEGAYAIYMKILDSKKKLSKYPEGSISQDIKSYLSIAEMFFQAYSFYFLLEEHEDMKKKEDYGFGKKEFQLMIVENSVIAEEFLKIHKRILDFAKTDTFDGTQFAVNVTSTMATEVQR